MRWTMSIKDDGLGLCDGPKALDFIQRVWIGQLVNYMDWVLIKEFNVTQLIVWIGLGYI